MPPLVLTWTRWALLTAVGSGLLARAAYLAPGDFVNARTLAATIAGAWGLLVFFVLRGEESRLTRELRSARTGTPILRKLSLRRRRGAPFWSRWLSTTLGTTALFLADGDFDEARDRFVANPYIFRFGSIARLSAVVEADLDRAASGPAALEAAIAHLMKIGPLPHLEAERYRVHVLVKAILEQGDVAVARDLAEDLAARTDEELRVYVVWLRTWFDLEHLAPPSDADVRVALLLARSHGAEELVAKLALPLPNAPPSIADPSPRE